MEFYYSCNFARLKYRTQRHYIFLKNQNMDIFRLILDLILYVDPHKFQLKKTYRDNKKKEHWQTILKKGRQTYARRKESHQV